MPKLVGQSKGITNGLQTPTGRRAFGSRGFWRGVAGSGIQQMGPSRCGWEAAKPSSCSWPQSLWRFLQRRWLGIHHPIPDARVLASMTEPSPGASKAGSYCSVSSIGGGGFAGS